MKEGYEIFNVGTGRPVSVYELVTAFEKVNGVKLNYKFVARRPGDVMAIWADTQLANEELGWNTEDGIVTLEITNKGIFNKIAQKLFKKPKISYVHLDQTGSFVWPIIDGEKDIIKIGEEVKAHFGDACEPLYERLAKFFQILESYGFVKFK